MEYHTVQSVADMLKLKPRVIYDLLKRGDIDGLRIGRQIRFSQEQVDSFLRACVITRTDMHASKYRDQVAALVRNNPRIPLKEIAAAVGCNISTASRLRRQFRIQKNRKPAKAS